MSTNEMLDRVCDMATQHLIMEAVALQNWDVAVQLLGYFVNQRLAGIAQAYIFESATGQTIRDFIENGCIILAHMNQSIADMLTWYCPC